MTGLAKKVFALEARGDEAAPIEGVGALGGGTPGAEFGGGSSASRLDNASAALQTGLIEAEHPLLRGRIVNGPQAADHLAGAGGLEGAAEAEQAFAGLGGAAGGIAAGEDDEFGGVEAEGGHLFRGEQPVFPGGAAGGEDEAGAEEGVTGQSGLAVALAGGRKEEAVGG